MWWANGSGASIMSHRGVHLIPTRAVSHCTSSPSNLSITYHAASYSVWSAQSCISQRPRHQALYSVLLYGCANHSKHGSLYVPPIFTRLPVLRCLHSHKGCSSLAGQRSIVDLFHILDYFILVARADDYRLQKLDDNGDSLASPPVERSSTGNIAAGNYLIGRFPWAIYSTKADSFPEPAVEGGKIGFKQNITIFDIPFRRIDSPSMAIGGSTRVRICLKTRLCPFYQFLTCNRIPLTINRALKWDLFIGTKDVQSV
jgi:hypothetical protein